MEQPQQREAVIKLFDLFSRSMESNLPPKLGKLVVDS